MSSRACLSAALLGAALLPACTSEQGPGGGDPSNSPLATRDMELRAVDWNFTKAPLGEVGAVVESDQTIVVFGDAGATIFSAGVVASVDETVTTVKAGAVILAADHHGTWIAGADDKGQVWRLQGGDSFEGVSNLYGLSNDPVSALAAVGSFGTAFALGDGLAYSDGTNVVRFDTGPLGGLTGGQSRAAGVNEEGASTLDPAKGDEVKYDVPDANAVAFDDEDRLLVLSPDAIYREDDNGEVVPVYKSEGHGLRGLASAPGRVWFTDGSRLGLIDATGVALAPEGSAPGQASLTASASGDVWVVSGGALTRSAVDIGSADDRAAWEQDVQPIFHAACTPCHLPGGLANVVLSTYDTWVLRRDALKMHVIDKKDMPPSKTDLSDADRATLAAWITSSAH